MIFKFQSEGREIHASAFQFALEPKPGDVVEVGGDAFVILDKPRRWRLQKFVAGDKYIAVLEVKPI